MLGRSPGEGRNQVIFQTDHVGIHFWWRMCLVEPGIWHLHPLHPTVRRWCSIVTNLLIDAEEKSNISWILFPCRLFVIYAPKLMSILFIFRAGVLEQNMLRMCFFLLIPAGIWQTLSIHRLRRVFWLIKFVFCYFYLVFSPSIPFSFFWSYYCSCIKFSESLFLVSYFLSCDFQVFIIFSQDFKYFECLFL